MAIDPNLAQGLIAAGTAGVQAVTRGGPRRQFKWNSRAAVRTNEMNRENNEWILAQNKVIQDEQREYDSPKAQMKRYVEAGLNPHLIYGSSGSSGGVFPISAGQMPSANVSAPSAQGPDFAGDFIAASQAQTQMHLQDAKTVESQMKTQSLSLQNEISRTNPMLNPSVARAVSDSMEEVARLKSTEAYLWQQSSYDEKGRSNIQRKVESELHGMFQKLDLNTSDLAIKNKILESKDFENAIKKVQADWLEDATISPEHVRQGLMLILSKMMGR